MIVEAGVEATWAKLVAVQEVLSRVMVALVESDGRGLPKSAGHTLQLMLERLLENQPVGFIIGGL